MKNLILYAAISAACSGFWASLVGVLGRIAKWPGSVPWIVFIIGFAIGVFALCITGSTCKDVELWDHI